MAQRWKQRVRPSADYSSQFPSLRDAVGTVLSEKPRGFYEVRWDGLSDVETIPTDCLVAEARSEDEAGEFEVLDAYDNPYVGHTGRSREEAIAVHVSHLWSNYLDEFPAIPRTLVRGRLSSTQMRAWVKSVECGCRVRSVITATTEARHMGRPEYEPTADELKAAKEIWQDVIKYPEWHDAETALHKEVNKRFKAWRAHRLWGGRKSSRAEPALRSKRTKRLQG